MLLFVGLGNPTPDSENNRHNVGFMALDKVSSFHKFGRSRTKFLGRTSMGAIDDRPVIVRDKVNRRDRVGAGSIYNQLDDDIFAVVTYNSIAATEAIGYGIPCFTLAPNAADEFCEKNLTLIETPMYADKDKVTNHVLGDLSKEDSETLDKIMLFKKILLY